MAANHRHFLCIKKGVEMMASNHNSRQLRKNIFLFVFLLFPMVLLGMFVVYPTIQLIRLSFTDWNGISKIKDNIGIENYINIIKNSPNLWLSLKNNSIYFLGHLLFIPLEIFTAFLLTRKLRAAKLFKTIVFLPYIINGVAVAYMFAMLFSSEGGAINEIFKVFSISPVKWLSDKSIVNYSLTTVSLWRFSGMHVVLFLAALNSVPQDMLEAAEVDGANVFKQYRYIIIPNIMTVIELVLFLNVRGALQVFDIPFVMTSGGPGHASSTFIMYTIETAFNFDSIGKASSMAVVLMVLIILISKIQKKLVSGKE